MKVFVIGGIAGSLINFRGPLLKAMVDRGHCVFTATGETTPELASHLKNMRVTHHDIPLDRVGLNPLNDLSIIYRLIALFHRVKPDLTLNYTIKPVIYGSIAARLSGVARACSMIEGLGYAFTGDGLKRKFIKQVSMALYKTALKSNFALFFLNPDDKRFFTNSHLLENKLTTVILNGIGVDLAHYPSVPITQAPSFLLIARLLGDKGIREYVAAACRVRAKYPHVVFRLVGGRDPNPACIPVDEVREWVREGLIEYLGELKDVRSAIAASSVYVLPSYREGTPRTVLEAMSMGRPIITTDAPGCRETIKRTRKWWGKNDNHGIIRGENGFLVPVKDVDSLAHAMEQFIENPELIEEMGAHSREIAEEKYDVHKVNAVILETMGL